MKIVVTGGTGFLGAPLCESLVAGGHDVKVLSRFHGGTYNGVQHVRAQVIGGADAHFEPTGASAIEAADAVINLAGESIDRGRWTPQRKIALRNSRLFTTRAIVSAMAASLSKPAVLISGSAVGYYGSDLSAVRTEQSPAGTDFLATLCSDWEQEATKAESLGVRVVRVRTGLVLGPKGGLLARMVPPFKMFVGGPIGSGAQWMSWIHRDDWISLVRWALDHSDVTGALNATSPHPATNRDFSRALGHALHRPSMMPLPAFVVRLMFGEMADGALLASQRVEPAAAVASGFSFALPDLPQALARAIRTLY